MFFFPPALFETPKIKVRVESSCSLNSWWSSLQDDRNLAKEDIPSHAAKVLAGTGLRRTQENRGAGRGLLLLSYTPFKIPAEEELGGGGQGCWFVTVLKNHMAEGIFLCFF